jgi:septum site-determining protein MinC
MLEPAARSLAHGHGDAPTSQTPGEAGGVADPGETLDTLIEIREEEGIPVLQLNTECAFEAWRDQAMRRFGSDPDLVSRCRELSLHIDVGEGKVDRFDLRRMAHLLNDEFTIEVTALRCSEAALLSYGESELKMEIIVNRPAPVASAEPEVQPSADPPLLEVPVQTSLIEQESQGIDPVEFEEDDDSLEFAPAIEPSFEETDLDPVTPVLVVEEDEHTPGVQAVDENLGEQGTGPSQGGWTSRPLVREEHGTAGERLVMVVDRTLRSGGRVSFAGDVFVYGDVNAGAEIQAEGNIIVLGALRGHAHAGARGDEGAIVLAFDLRPTHLCIASTRACLDPVEPEANPSRLQGLMRRGRQESGGFAPEIAHLCDGEIQQQPYSGRFPNS